MNGQDRTNALAAGINALMREHEKQGTHLRIPDDPENYRDGIDTTCPGGDECLIGKQIGLLAQIMQEEVDKQKATP